MFSDSAFFGTLGIIYFRVLYWVRHCLFFSLTTFPIIIGSFFSRSLHDINYNKKCMRQEGGSKWNFVWELKLTAAKWYSDKIIKIDNQSSCFYLNIYFSFPLWYINDVFKNISFYFLLIIHVHKYTLKIYFY